MANGYFSILPKSDDVIKLQQSFNTRPLLDQWRAPEFLFDDMGNKKARKPSVRMLGGGFAFRSDLKSLLFPGANDNIEFLPISVSAESWTVANCLNATDSYDAEKSIFYRDLDGTIFMIIHAVFTDSNLTEKDIFVIEDSNRAFLFALPQFRDRILKLSVEGVIFREIGSLEPKP